MAPKIYWMARPRWPGAGCGFRAFACREVSAPCAGAVSLTVLDGMERPIVAKTPSGPLVVAADGFHWLQFAPRETCWWLTAMFDGKRRLVQFYFDVTFENHILPRGESWCRDAYLDVILEPDGTMRVLDADELEAALASGEITQAAYRHAHAVAASLLDQFSGRAAELETRCRAWLEMLAPRA